MHPPSTSSVVPGIDSEWCLVSNCSKSARNKGVMNRTTHRCHGKKRKIARVYFCAIVAEQLLFLFSSSMIQSSKEGNILFLKPAVKTERKCTMQTKTKFCLGNNDLSKLSMVCGPQSQSSFCLIYNTYVLRGVHQEKGKGRRKKRKKHPYGRGGIRSKLTDCLLRSV